jgi:hypothetical protein
MPAHPELRKYRVRIRDGDAAGIQRGGGDTVITDHCESVRLLATGDSTCLVAGSARRVRIERRVFLNCHCRGRYCGNWCSAFSSRPLEAAEDLIVGPVSSSRINIW